MNKQILQVKKKRKKNSKRWLILLVGMLAVAGGIFAWLATREKEPMPTRTETGGSIVNRETSEIQWMKIQIRGKEAWTAERNADGALVMTSDMDGTGEQDAASGSSEERAEDPDSADGWTMDATLGERIENALANLVYEDILTEDAADYQDRLAEFGLAEPSLIAEVRYTDGTEMIIRIGDDSGMEDEDFRFMTIDGDPRLYAVAGSLMEDLNVEEELLHPVSQPEIQTSRVDRITIRNREGEITAEWALAGKITDADAAENWQVTVPVVYPADQDQISNLKKNAGNLRLGLYIGPGTQENKAAYGLDTPEYVLEVHMAAGTTGQIVDGGAYNVQDWGEETVTFLIGTSRNEMTDYCLYGNTIYTMNHFTAAAIAELNPMDTLARYPVTVATENLSRMEIAREDGSREVYALTYATVPAEEEGAEDQTIVTCAKNGEEISYAAFEAAYERMRVVNVSGQLPAGWEKQETRVKYTFQTLSGGVHTVELSDFDAMHDAVTVDGWTLFYLIKGGMGEMP